MAPMESCCCGFNLRVGSLIIGWISTVYGILKLVINVVGGWSISKLSESITITNFANQNSENPPPPEVQLSFFSVENVIPVGNVVMAIALVVLVSMDKKQEVKWWSYLSAALDVLTLIIEVLSNNFIFPIIGYLIDVYCVLIAYSYAVSVAPLTSQPV